MSNLSALRDAYRALLARVVIEFDEHLEGQGTGQADPELEARIAREFPALTAARKLLEETQ